MRVKNICSWKRLFIERDDAVSIPDRRHKEEIAVINSDDTTQEKLHVEIIIIIIFSLPVRGGLARYRHITFTVRVGNFCVSTVSSLQHWFSLRCCTQYCTFDWIHSKFESYTNCNHGEKGDLSLWVLVLYWVDCFAWGERFGFAPDAGLFAVRKWKEPTTKIGNTHGNDSLTKIRILLFDFTPIVIYRRARHKVAADQSRNDYILFPAIRIVLLPGIHERATDRRRGRFRTCVFGATHRSPASAPLFWFAEQQTICT